MKKTLIILLTTFIFSANNIELVQAQACGRNFIPNFVEGKTDLSFGIGFGTHWKYPWAYTTFPLINASIDHGLREDIGPGVIGVGGYLGYERFRDEFVGGQYGYNYASVIIMGRATYHYQFIENFDTYAGLGLGIRYVHASPFGILPVNMVNPDEGVRPSASLFIGGRYFFSETVAAFAEASLGVSYLTLGVTFRLREMLK
jgi:hypothetical protein